MSKHLFNRLISLFLVFVSLFTISVPVMATDSSREISPSSSEYISSVWATCSSGNGSITTEFSITAKSKMNSLGATTIEIKNSSDTTVKLFTYETTSSMMGSNRVYYKSSVTWYGASSGSKYYAIVYFKAANSSGNDTTMYTTSYAYAG